MCHDIEDPTFDATAVATNPKAQVRPVHRPPRMPGRPAPALRVDGHHRRVPPAGRPRWRRTTSSRRPARPTLELDPIDPADEGASDYSGPLLSDLDFARVLALRAGPDRRRGVPADAPAEPVASCTRSGSARPTRRRRVEIATKQLTGIAGIAAERIHRALGLPGDAGRRAAGARAAPAAQPGRVRRRHASTASPLSVEPVRGHRRRRLDHALRPGPSHAPLQAIVRAVDPHLDVEVDDYTEARAGPRPLRASRTSRRAEAGEVAVTRFSTGASFAFEPRRSLPITPV